MQQKTASPNASSGRPSGSRCNQSLIAGDVDHAKSASRVQCIAFRASQQPVGRFTARHFRSDRRTCTGMASSGVRNRMAATPYSVAPQLVSALVASPRLRFRPYHMESQAIAFCACA
jgi:hypothetical protein